MIFYQKTEQKTDKSQTVAKAGEILRSASPSFGVAQVLVCTSSSVLEIPRTNLFGKESLEEQDPL